MFDFPNSPTVGQVFGNYTWDGEKWKQTSNAILPSNNVPLMDGAASSGTALPYTRDDHIHPSDTSRAAANTVVRYDTAQSLTVAQQAQARSNVYAAPFDALAYNGMQINGAMEVSQEKGINNPVAAGYVCDGWLVSKAGTSVISAAQGVIALGGFANLFSLAVTTAEPAMGAGDYVSVQQPIEGYRLVRLGWGTANAQPITIGFWTSHVRTGTYSVAVTNGTSNRSYVTTYTQNVSAALEYKTVTIPGDTAGAWAINNTVGIYVIFNVACGTILTAPAANVWASANYHAAPGQVNGVTATSDIFRLAGVAVLPGTEAPSAARSPLIMRPFDQELLTCRRYYYNRNVVLLGYAPSAAGLIGQWLSHPVQMRAAPTITFSGASYSNAGSLTFDTIDNDGCRCLVALTAAGTGYLVGAKQISDARL